MAETKEMRYQYNYSDGDPVLYDLKGREQKANKILSVLKDYYHNDLSSLSLLDVGSSTGIMTWLLSKHFKKTIGIDIDTQGVAHAQETYKSENLSFQVGDSMNLPFADNSFDVINCTQVYEHVPDSTRLMVEIYRVLKPGGVCFFAAGNRFVLMEGHYNLPFLSVIPKSWGHIYLKVLNRGDYYYETHFSYWGLKKLVSKFEIIDFTKKIIRYPNKYYANEMITEGSFKHKVYLSILDIAYWLCPNYIWLLKK